MTLRDATDLIAIVVLIPLGVALRHSAHTSAGTASGSLRTFGQSPAARGAAVLPIVGALAAVFATTATSCGPRPAVDRLVVVDGVVYAEVVSGYANPTWARTDDGRTWTKVQRPQAVVRPSDDDPYEAKVAGPLRACGEDGTCFRLRNQRAIEVTTATGETVEEYTLTEAQLASISTGCAGAQRGVLSSVAAPTENGRPAMASLGANGVVVRQVDGRWQRIDVLDAHPPSPEPPAALRFGLLAFGPMLALGIWVFARDRWPSWRVAIGVALGGWLGSMSLAGIADFMSEPDGHFGVAVVWPAGCFITLVTAVIVGKSTRFAPRRGPFTWEMLPPPPDPSNGSAS